MDLASLATTLGYRSSANFLTEERFEQAPEHAHIFRRAIKTCRLHGVYVLREQLDDARATTTPIVYLASATSVAEADAIHRLVWNQNVVPFLLVRLPTCARLYSGFSYERPARDGGTTPGVLESAIAFNEVATRLRSLTSDAIDNGNIWREHSRAVSPNARVDWRLLENLQALARWLRAQGLDTRVAHALIGKFVYLRYLRDRDILSERKLAEWSLTPSRVFGRSATLSDIRELVTRVDYWLNGSIFPIPFDGDLAPSEHHLEKVVHVFLGDQVADGQMHLDFRAYDFSHIPIETLSIIYEQFLALEGSTRTTGAYYTPVPLVNFMLGELADLSPLKPGMRVFDPACGSGAFLVQCYRRLIENSRRERSGATLRPVELRELLVKHIFGVDRDLDACRVAQLSLVLTMLDYIDPPDLASTPTFKLPNLHNSNIFEGDFFELGTPVAHQIQARTYDWIVGNPPWLDASETSSSTRLARSWIEDHRAANPVVGNDVAEAFAWKVLDHLAPGGMAALLMPAMSLFREHGHFRKAFFSRCDVAAVANFANLREVLFAQRARMPAAALFYSASSDQRRSSDSVLVFSPMVANQAANLPAAPNERMPTWNITLNHSEVRSVTRETLASGDNLPWKLAMWGSHRDATLLRSLSRRFPSLLRFAQQRGWVISQGLELRDSDSSEAIEPLKEVIGQRALLVDRLRKSGPIHSFPDYAIAKVPSARGFVRKGRSKAPLAASRGPHVVVSAARTFAVFDSHFLVVPHPHIGIAGKPADRDALLALALFLNSSFATYHQFFMSPQEGVRDGRGTLRALRQLPVPLDRLDADTVKRCQHIHAQLVATSKRETDFSLTAEEPTRDAASDVTPQIDALTMDLLGLTRSERSLIEDMVNVRIHLSDGRYDRRAIRTPELSELRDYALTLCGELDTFVDAPQRGGHQITVVFDSVSAMVAISLVEHGPKNRVTVLAAEDAGASVLRGVRSHWERHAGQWTYFDRNLMVHVDDHILIFKPLQLMWWTRTQAAIDADELIAETLAPDVSA